MQPQVRPISRPLSNTYTYVVSDPVIGFAAVIDPVWISMPVGRTGVDSVSAVQDYLRSEDLQLRWILELMRMRPITPPRRTLVEVSATTGSAGDRLYPRGAADLQSVSTWAMDSPTAASSTVFGRRRTLCHRRVGCRSVGHA